MGACCFTFYGKNLSPGKAHSQCPWANAANKSVGTRRHFPPCPTLFGVDPQPQWPAACAAVCWRGPHPLRGTDCACVSSISVWDALVLVVAASSLSMYPKCAEQLLGLDGF